MDLFLKVVLTQGASYEHTVPVLETKKNHHGP